MAELSTLARPYARAAFDFAQEANELDQWEEYLLFSSGLLQDESFADYLSRPSVSDQQKLQAMINVSNDSFPKAFKNFLAQLADNQRLPLLPAIFGEYQLLKSAANNMLNAKVESAYDLTDDEVSAITSGLEKRFDTKVSMQVEINPELLAGVVITIGDQVIDDSAVGKLKLLKAKLTA